MKIINLFFCNLLILLSTNLVKAQSTVFETLATFGKHTNEVTSLCFSPDNRYLFTGSKITSFVGN